MEQNNGKERFQINSIDKEFSDERIGRLSTISMEEGLICRMRRSGFSLTSHPSRLSVNCGDSAFTKVAKQAYLYFSVGFFVCIYFGAFRKISGHNYS